MTSVLFLIFLHRLLTVFGQNNVEPDFMGIGHDENGAERPVVTRTRLFDQQAVFIQDPTESVPAVSTPPELVSDDVPGQNPRQGNQFPPDNRFPSFPVDNRFPVQATFPENRFPSQVAQFPADNRFTNQGAQFPQDNRAPFPMDNRFPDRQLENQRPVNSAPQGRPLQMAPQMFPPSPNTQVFPGRFQEGPKLMPVASTQQRFVNPDDQQRQFFMEQASLPNKQLVLESGQATMGNAASHPGLASQTAPVQVENLPLLPQSDPNAGMGTLGAGPIPEGMMTGIQLPSGPPVPLPAPPQFPQQPPQPMFPPGPPMQPQVQAIPAIVPGQRIPVVNGVPVLPGRQTDFPPGQQAQDIPPANDNQNTVPIGQPDISATMDRMHEMTSGLASTQQELMDRINQQSGVIAFLMKSLVKENPVTETAAPISVGVPPNNKPSGVSTGFL